MPETGLVFYAIHDHPKDYPDSWVVRVWRIVRGDDGVSRPKPDMEPHALCGTLDEARKSLPYGLYNLNRGPDDDPVIKETWI